MGKYELIHVLINNAGTIGDTYNQIITEDGFEMTMATNYLGHALMNHFLLDLVKKAGKVEKDSSRIILVSSIGATNKKAASELCERNAINNTYSINFLGDGTLQYFKSKLAQIMYGKHL